MGATHKLIRGLCCLAIAIAMPHAFAADTTGAGASSTPKPKGAPDVVKTSKDGVETRELPGARKADRERREQGEKERKGKK